MHIEFLLEEESSAAAMNELIPKIIGDRASVRHHVFQGKPDLLNKLPARLKAYRKWLPAGHRILVLLDRDNDDCQELKTQLDDISANAGLHSHSRSDQQGSFEVLTRIAIEELESWFFGDVEALTQAYPRVPATLAQRRGYRDPDAIAGGTWEKLERVLQDAGYYSGGMPKIEVARNIARYMDPIRNRSHSFQVFLRGLRALVA